MFFVISTILIALLTLTSFIAYRYISGEKLSKKWKESTVQERGFIIDPIILQRKLFRRTKKEVINFLGKPDFTGSILTSPDGKPRLSQKESVLLTNNFMYDCGNMDGPYNWTFIVSFDENGLVYQMGLDD